MKLIQNKMNIKFTVCLISLLLVIGSVWTQVTISFGIAPPKVWYWI